MQPQVPIPDNQPLPPQPQPPFQPMSPAVPAPVVPIKSRKMPKWLKIVLIIITVFIVFIVGAYFVTSSATKAPQKVSDQFINAVQSGDTAAAYALTSATFKNTTTQDQLDSVIKQVGPLLQGDEKITGRTIAKSTSVPTTAVLVYAVPTSSGTNYVKTELQKSGDSWQIINFRTDNKQINMDVE